MNHKTAVFPGMFAAITAAGIGGCLAIYAACSYRTDPTIFLLRQFFWLAAGLFIFTVSARIPFRFYRKNAVLLGTVGFLLLTLVMVFGCVRNGMRGWLPLPFGMTFQPSDLGKAFFLLLIVRFAVDQEIPEWKRGTYVTGIGVLFSGLTLLEPDLGSGTVYFLAALIVLTAAGFSMRWPFFLLCGAAGAAGLFLLKHPYALRRIVGFLDPNADFYGSGWHIRQFQYAMAQGGLFGTDSGGAVWANAYLPLSHSDSAFATILETSGVAGGLIIVAGFAAMVFVMRHIAERKADHFSALYIFSAGALCAAQAAIHLSVNVTMLPVTGLTLPFFSYGGSSLIGMILMFGIACSAADSE